MPPPASSHSTASRPRASTLRVRPETPADFEAIDHVAQLAFGRVDEAEIVRRVRASRHYIPELALVAEDEGQLVGHVMFSDVELRGEESLAVPSLAPLSVKPEWQLQGVGTALVEAGLAAAEARREPLVVVVGPPRYYPRFGFEPARPYGIEPPAPGVPDEVFMVKLLSGYDGRQRGQVVYPSAFRGF